MPPSLPTKLSMADAEDEIQFQYLPFIRIYKSGRFERPVVITDHVPPSLDPSTNVASKDAVIDPDTNVSARLYIPDPSARHPSNKLPLVIYFHGGGFCIGSAFSSSCHQHLNSLVSKSNVVAVSVEYRLAPEHPLPRAFDDSWAALKWVASHAAGDGPDAWLNHHADFKRVFLAGVSAGANIAHNMAMRAGEAGGLGHGVSVEGLVLVQPYFWGNKRLASETDNDGQRLLNVALLDAQWPAVCPEAKDNDDFRVNPLADGGPALAGLGCRRALVAVAGRDLLCERGKAYYEALKGSGWGGEVELVETEGEDHGFHLFKAGSEKAEDLMGHRVAFFNRE